MAKRGQRSERRADYLRSLTRDKLHLRPGALAAAPPAIRVHFESDWEPVVVFRRQLERFPVGLIQFWSLQERGHVIVGADVSRYVPGPQQSGTHELDGVAHVSLDDLVLANNQPLLAIGHLLDHLIGCLGAMEEAWLSDGGGITPRWREVGEALQELHALGYSESEAARADVHRYFAEGLAGFCRDRRRLNVADPLLERLLGRTVMSESFWDGGGAIPPRRKADV
jgi:hypothetical protein